MQKVDEFEPKSPKEEKEGKYFFFEKSHLIKMDKEFEHTRFAQYQFEMLSTSSFKDRFEANSPTVVGYYLFKTAPLFSCYCET